MEVTPSNLPVAILNEDPITMEEGAEIRIRMKLFGFLPLGWLTKITKWQPPDYFVDEQPKGPYRYWKHTHRFEELEEGTMIIDELEFAVPGWIFEPIIYHLVVKRTLVNLFDYRQEVYPNYLSQVQ